MKFVKLSDDCIILEENGNVIFSWENRNEILSRWADKSLDKEKNRLFTKFIKEAKDII